MAKKNKSFSKGENVHITFNSEGYIVKAKGFSLILWSNDPDNLDESLIGKHAYDLLSMFKEYSANPSAYENFEKNVVNKLKLKKKKIAIKRPS